MNITPNYSVNFFRFNQKVNEDNGQTQPNELTQPAFKMNNKTVMTSATALGAAVIGGIKAAENLNAKKETQIPTREEFDEILKKHFKPTTENYKAWLEAYDMNPEATMKFYNMKNSDGKLFRKDGFVIGYITNDSHPMIHYPELFQKMVDMKDELGLNKFQTFYDVYSALLPVNGHEKGLFTMMDMKDSFGNPRFTSDDYFLAAYFEESPDLAIKYANAVNDINNPRFSSHGLSNLMSAANEFGAETIDGMIDLRRKDGSFIYNNHKAPYKNEVKAYTEHNKSFVDLCNIKLASGEYINPDLASNTELIKAYEYAPEETIKLLQMPMPSSPANNRFSPNKIGYNAVYLYRDIPKTFRTIANMTDSNGGYRFGLEDIEEFTCSGLCFDFDTMKSKEMDYKLLKNIGELAKVSYRDEFREGRKLTAKEISYSLAAYNKYPKETIEIIQNYRYYGDKPFTPSIQEVELYINNKEEFETYQQEERDLDLERKLAEFRARK